MPSPITTSGFHVSERPRVDFMDPRLLVPQYDRIVPNIMQGAQMVNGIAQIADDARMRPIRRRLAEIQLENAPLEQAALQQRLAVPQIIPGDVSYEDMTVEYPAAIDENGMRTGPADRESGDLVQIQEVREIGPGGVITPRTVRKVVKTAAERQMEAEKQAANLEAIGALAEQRRAGKTYESEALIQGYNSALERGDGEEAAMFKALLDRKAALPGILPTGTAFQRRMEQIAADAGVTLEIATNLAKTPEGMQALTTQAAANKAAARDIMGAPQPTPQQRALLGGAGTVAAVDDDIDAILGSAPATGATPSFATDREAAAAAAAGLIKRGQKIIVNGVSGTWN